MPFHVFAESHCWLSCRDTVLHSKITWGNLCFKGSVSVLQRPSKANNMAFISLWLSYVLVPVILSLGYVIYQRLLSPVAKFPGPFVASITPLWKVCALTKRTYHETVLALHKQYGKIVRIGPNELLLSDPAAVREIYVSPEFLKVRKSSFKPFLF